MRTRDKVKFGLELGVGIFLVVGAAVKGLYYGYVTGAILIAVAFYDLAKVKEKIKRQDSGDLLHQ